MSPQSNRWLQLLPPLAVLGIGLGVMALLQAPEPDRQAATRAADTEADYFLQDARIRSYGPDGALLQSLSAARVAHYPDNSARLEEVEVTRMPGPWSLRASHGLMPIGLQELALSGEVQVQTTLPDGSPAELRTSALTVDWALRELRSDAPVEMISNQTRASALYLLAHMDRRDIQLDGEVRVEHQP